jgi:hypothetical protein
MADPPIHITFVEPEGDSLILQGWSNGDDDPIFSRE